jgi:hypothetical protein
MVALAHSAFSALNAKLAGWISGGARRRSDIVCFLALYFAKSTRLISPSLNV